MSLTQIREAIVTLTQNERSELTDWLIEHNRPSDEEEEASLKLAHQRMAEIAAGTKRLIPQEEVWGEIEAIGAKR